MVDENPSTDPHVTLHEERLQVRTVWAPHERVVLRRRITTEVRRVEVTVRREELHVERQPVDHDASLPGGDATRSPLVIILSEEVPVVGVETRPYERVTVTIDTITQEHNVLESVAKERADVATEPAVTP